MAVSSSSGAFRYRNPLYRIAPSSFPSLVVGRRDASTVASAGGEPGATSSIETFATSVCALGRGAGV